MMAECEVANEYVDADDAARLTIIETTPATPAVASDLVGIVLGVTLAAAAALSDEVRNNSRASPAETAAFTDLAYTVGAFSGSVNEDTRATDRVVLAFEGLAAETGAFTDAATASGALNIARDQADFTDAGLPLTRGLPVAAEDADLADAVRGFKQALAADTGDFADVVRLYAFEDVSDTAAFSDAVVIARPAVARDRARITDAAIPMVGTARDITESLAIYDGTRVAIAITFEDSAALSDAAVLGSGTALVVAEAATITDAAEIVEASSWVAAESGVFTDAAIAVVTAAAVLEEQAVIEDFVVLPGEGRAWAVPTDAMAMSRYELPEAVSIAEFDGALYVAGPGGLYRLEAGADDADAGLVEATVRGGLTDFGSSALKRASAFYIGYTSPGKLRVTVGSIPEGVEQSRSYEFPQRVADSPMPGKAKLGRGDRARYWRVTLENVDGADFMVDSQEMDADTMSRRV